LYQVSLLLRYLTSSSLGSCTSFMWTMEARFSLCGELDVS
jgi:hypothetical protein